MKLVWFPQIASKNFASTWSNSAKACKIDVCKLSKVLQGKYALGGERIDNPNIET
jgi:hypothetical protein